MSIRTSLARQLDAEAVKRARLKSEESTPEFYRQRLRREERNFNRVTPEKLSLLQSIPPQTIYEHMRATMPDLMPHVDVMLKAGATPEWISMRGEFLDMPVEIQTVMINALHWRQSYLLSGGN